ncbi:hypothetical protein FRX31_012269, partial [Thalictrum thalictroides]
MSGFCYRVSPQFKSFRVNIPSSESLFFLKKIKRFAVVDKNRVWGKSRMTELNTTPVLRSATPDSHKNFGISYGSSSSSEFSSGCLEYTINKL